VNKIMLSGVSWPLTCWCVVWPCILRNSVSSFVLK
jgi:hypothetical protein